MKLVVGIKDNLSQIFAIAERNVREATRHKLPIILSYFTPIISIIVPLIILGRIITFNNNFGPWDGGNYIVYQFTAYQIVFLYQIINRFTGILAQEKSLNTFTILIIAPFRRINLLFGIFLTHITLISIPFLIFLIWCYILYPISIITLFFIFFVYFLITLFFSGIGLFFAIFILSKPHLQPLLSIPLTILMMFSCLGLPFEFFPKNFQNIARLNPFYYVFIIARYIWIEDNIIFSITFHPFIFLVVIFLALTSPILGLKVFNYIFDKYRIQIY